MSSPITIAGVREKCKSLFDRYHRDLLILAILMAASVLSFGLGYLAGLDAVQENGLTLKASPLISTSADGQVVASKSGMKYYLPWCAGADRISDANKVWFASASAASEAGYAPAENCKGL